MKKFLTLLLLLSGCSNVGPGFVNHPIDCAMGITWADCLPGTKGYENGGGQIHREAAQKEQALKKQQAIIDTNNAIQQMPN